MPTKPRVLGTQHIAKSRIFNIESVHLEFSNGEVRHYERLSSTGNDAVMVIPIIDEHLLLVREYSVGVEDYVLGFAKGLIDPGEEIMDAANRELQEEVGYAAKHLEYLKLMVMNPGYTNQRTHIIKATQLYPSALPGDEPEPLEVVRWPLNKVADLITRDDFIETRSIAALMWLMNTTS